MQQTNFPSARGRLGPPTPTVPQRFLCSYHTTLVIPWNHTDDQCRDGRYPKFARPKAIYVHTDIAYTPDTRNYVQPRLLSQSTCYPLKFIPQSTAKHATHYPTSQVHPDVLPEHDSEVNGNFILDSGEHLSHAINPPKTLQPL